MIKCNMAIDFQNKAKHWSCPVHQWYFLASSILKVFGIFLFKNDHKQILNFLLHCGSKALCPFFTQISFFAQCTIKIFELKNTFSFFHVSFSKTKAKIPSGGGSTAVGPKLAKEVSWLHK